ncbi:hypothetical protein ATO6_08525 [Oceanicola sp. 22II-s10i]|nr:hypothetical protein ATO6_08525 [Oceanicola sp. 22II-s10i]
MLRRPVLTLCATALSLAAPVALAHPHIFVDTALSVRVDASGLPVGIEVTWKYDELYSLLIFEDMGLDPDYDGVLTAPELAEIQRFDMHWIEGFEGDLYASGSDGRLAFGPPEPISTTVDGGRIETRHFRPFAATAPRELSIRAYDPTFYTAYDLTGGVHAPAGCTVAIEKADVEAAQARLAKELGSEAADTDDFPEVGDAFADTVTLTCEAGS